MACEIALHESLPVHPSILQFEHSFEDATNVYILTEFCPGSTLFTYLQNNYPTGISESQARPIFLSLVQAVSFLHLHGILHRDLKLTNVLLTDTLQVRLADFGLATKLSDVSQDQEMTMCGTPNYISPEIVRRLPYGLASDVWSMGCILVTLLTGRPPFQGDHISETLQLVAKGIHRPLPRGSSRDAKHLVDSILQVDSTRRLNMAEILVHPFLASSAAQRDIQTVSLSDSFASMYPGTSVGDPHYSQKVPISLGGQFSSMNPFRRMPVLPKLARKDQPMCASRFSSDIRSTSDHTETYPATEREPYFGGVPDSYCNRVGQLRAHGYQRTQRNESMPRESDTILIPPEGREPNLLARCRTLSNSSDASEASEPYKKHKQVLSHHQRSCTRPDEIHHERQQSSAPMDRDESMARCRQNEWENLQSKNDHFYNEAQARAYEQATLRQEGRTDVGRHTRNYSAELFPPVGRQVTHTRARSEHPQYQNAFGSGALYEGQTTHAFPQASDTRPTMNEPIVSFKDDLQYLPTGLDSIRSSEFDHPDGAHRQSAGTIPGATRGRKTSPATSMTRFRSPIKSNSKVAGVHQVDFLQIVDDIVQVGDPKPERQITPDITSDDRSSQFVDKYRFSTADLRPTCQSTKHGSISILESGEVSVAFTKETRKYLFSSDGGQISLVEENGATKAFSLAELPARYLLAYRYASKFVNVIRSRTVKIALDSSSAKCRLYYNDTFEIALSKYKKKVTFCPKTRSAKVADHDSVLWKGQLDAVDPSVRDLVRQGLVWWGRCKDALTEPPDQMEARASTVQYTPADESATSGARFVDGQGWCERREDGKLWVFFFLDGVSLGLDTEKRTAVLTSAENERTGYALKQGLPDAVRDKLKIASRAMREFV